MRRLYYYRVTVRFRMSAHVYDTDVSSKYFETESEAETAAISREMNMKADFGDAYRHSFYEIYSDIVSDGIYQEYNKD